MKTIYAQAQKGRVVLQEKEIGKPGPREVLIKVTHSSMSPGTECGLLHEQIVPLPTQIGYSAFGQIEEVGSEVWEFKKGDLVISTVEHAKYVITAADNVTLCPPNIDPEQAAFWNLSMTGIYSLRQASLTIGEPCIVMGEGFVGTITARLAMLAGACPVILTGHHDEKLAVAKQMGIDYVINTKTDPNGLDTLMNKLQLEIPVIFEATGSRQALMDAARLIGERGRIIMISQVHGESMPPIDNDLMQKGASLIGTYVNSRPYKLKRADLEITGTWPPTIAPRLKDYRNKDIYSSDTDIQNILTLISYGRLDIRPLISHRFDWSKIPEAYASYVFPHPSKDITGGLICWE